MSAPLVRFLALSQYIFHIQKFFIYIYTCPFIFFLKLLNAFCSVVIFT